MLWLGFLGYTAIALLILWVVRHPYWDLRNKDSGVLFVLFWPVAIPLTGFLWAAFRFIEFCDEYWDARVERHSESDESDRPK